MSYRQRTHTCAAIMEARLHYKKHCALRSADFAELLIKRVIKQWKIYSLSLSASLRVHFLSTRVRFAVFLFRVC